MNLEEKINQIKADYGKAVAKFSVEIKDYANWHYNLDELFIKFEKGDKSSRFSIIPVGTYSSEYHSFLWSWANNDFSENARMESAKLKLAYSEFPFKAFQVEGFKCMQEELDEILAISLYHLNGKVIFKIKDENPWLFLCVL